MFIERLSVEGGFLDGLDLSLVPGLNVLIGERGTGKTSVIELLRYVLAAGSLVEGAGSARDERARSVLGDGAVHAEIRTDDGVLLISRAHRDDAPRATTRLPSYTVVGQGEMEAIGLEAASRLRLLDRYAGEAMSAEAREATSALSSVQSLTEQLARIRDDLNRVRESLEPLESVPELLAQALEEQKAGLESVDATQEESEHLATLQSAVESLRQSISQVDEAASVAADNHEALNYAVSRWREVQLPTLDDSENEAARSAMAGIQRAHTSLTEAAEHSSNALDHLQNLRRGLDQRLSDLDEQTRTLRTRLEELKSGLSAAARTVENLREQAGTRSALLERQQQLRDEASAIAAKRRSRYAEIDELREKRRDRRISVAADLTDQYGPEVRIRVMGGADRSRFASAIVEALTGSGLHYNTLAPLLSESLTPLELVEASEQLDEDRIAEAAGIPSTRAAQVALQLSTSDLGRLALSPIEDAVSFELLDGTEYKEMKALSIGQRCTVVLPVILGAPTAGLILDQPEDNLDNAFLATTIVPGIAMRASSSQVIIATHNPNIPVLGDASLVAHMGSDGSRGYVVSVGPLEESTTRRAITDIMEGGQEAFDRRASFYGGSSR